MMNAWYVGFEDAKKEASSTDRKTKDLKRPREKEEK